MRRRASRIEAPLKRFQDRRFEDWRGSASLPRRTGSRDIPGRRSDPGPSTFSGALAVQGLELSPAHLLNCGRVAPDRPGAHQVAFATWRARRSLVQAKIPVRRVTEERIRGYVPPLAELVDDRRCPVPARIAEDIDAGQDGSTPPLDRGAAVVEGDDRVLDSGLETAGSAEGDGAARVRLISVEGALDQCNVTGSGAYGSACRAGVAGERASLELRVPAIHDHHRACVSGGAVVAEDAVHEDPMGRHSDVDRSAP